MLEKETRTELNGMLYSINAPFLRSAYIETDGAILIELEDTLEDENKQCVYLHEDGITIINGSCCHSSEGNFTIHPETLHLLAMLSACFAAGHEKGLHDAEEMEARRKARKEQK